MNANTFTSRESAWTLVEAEARRLKRTALQSLFPHARSGWDGGGSRHRSTSQSNAGACARCHDNPENNLTPDCFNNSLCHGDD